MKKAIFFALAAIILASISCQFFGHEHTESIDYAQNDLSPKEVSNAEIYDDFAPKISAELPVSNVIVDETDNNNAPVAPPVVTHEGIYKMYDTAALDAEVITAAKRAGKDPQTYRKLVRRDPDNTEVYRAIGMHIVVTSMGEEYFIPDEL